MTLPARAKPGAIAGSGSGGRSPSMLRALGTIRERVARYGTNLDLIRNERSV